MDRTSPSTSPVCLDLSGEILTMDRFSPLPPRWMEDGGFQNDVRMTYCASVVQSVLAQRAFESESAIQYVRQCRVGPHSFNLHMGEKDVLIQTQTWEGAYSSRPGVIEGQGTCPVSDSLNLLTVTAIGGTSYCSIASLDLLQHDSGATLSREDKEETVRWLIQRQIGGFQGRPGKLEDVCYSFWIGGALHVSPITSHPLTLDESAL